MLLIEAPIHHHEGRFGILCNGCERNVDYATRAGALAALRRGNCSHCRIDYRARELDKNAIYKNADGKWCSSCSSCGEEQAYTRMDHAKTSSSSGWRCKACAGAEKAYSAGATGFKDNIRLGWLRRFELSAAQRGLTWSISVEDVNQLWEKQSGQCALSGVDLINTYKEETVSLDRIDSKRGYTTENIQLVHKVINMMKRSMSDEEFIQWSCRVAENNVERVSQ